MRSLISWMCVLAIGSVGYGLEVLPSKNPEPGRLVKIRYDGPTPLVRQLIKGVPHQADTHDCPHYVLGEDDEGKPALVKNGGVMIVTGKAGTIFDVIQWSPTGDADWLIITIQGEPKPDPDDDDDDESDDDNDDDDSDDDDGSIDSPYLVGGRVRSFVTGMKPRPPPEDLKKMSEVWGSVALKIRQSEVTQKQAVKEISDRTSSIVSQPAWKGFTETINKAFSDAISQGKISNYGIDFAAAVFEVSDTFKELAK